MRRGTSNTNVRGSASDRRARREWLLRTYGIPRRKDGRRTRIACHHCDKVMRASGPWEVDRFPVCGHAGGRYTRGNIRPSCAECNRSRCAVNGCRGGGGRDSLKPGRRADLWDLYGPPEDSAFDPDGAGVPSLHPPMSATPEVKFSEDR